jgi:hypothetical protein
MPPAVKCQDHYYPNEHEMNMVVMLILQQMASKIALKAGK